MNRKLIFTSFIFICIFLSYSISKKNSDNTENQKQAQNELKERTAAFDALRFFSENRAFPYRDIPPDAYSKAYGFYKNSKASYKNASFSGSWKNIGPNNVGGRTISIAIDPIDTGKIWLGSASGGLWKSSTGGIGVNAWTYVPTGFPVLAVSSIVIDPTNTNIMYIGTGETYSYGTSTNGLVDRTMRGIFGNGILKSTDGGITWTQSLNWSYQQNRGIWDIVINPKNTNILYAGTTEGIYKSNDAGATWTNVLAVNMAMDLAIDKKDTNIVYAGVGNLSSVNKGLYKTSNSGSTWNILTNGLPANTHDGRIIISTYENNNDILMVTICNAFSTVGTYRSKDKGVSWTNVTPITEIASYQGWYAKALLIKPDDTLQVLAGGVELYGSTSFGNNFVKLSSWFSNSSDYLHADIHDLIANPKDPNKIYIVTDGGLFRSNNFGNSYYECTDGYVTSQFYIGSVSSTDSSVALGGLQDNNTFQYTGSKYWNAVIGGDGCYNAIDPTDDNIQYGSYQYLNIFQSLDKWISFPTQIYFNSASSFNTGNTAAFLAPFVVCPSSTSVLYAGKNFIDKSTDGGLSWTPVGPDPLDNGNVVLAIAVSSKSTDTIYCATAPTTSFPMNIFRSYNGGTSFTNISATLPNRYPRRITVNPNNSKEVYVVFSGFGTGHIFKSTDAGNNWADISTSLPDVPFHCLAIDPIVPSDIYAGCDLTVYASRNGGNTWSAFDTGLPEAVMAFDLVISPSNNALLAYTHGHGVYTSQLNSGSIGIARKDLTVSALNIFPNPAKDNIHVKYNSEKESAVDILIYSLSGQLVHKQNTIASQGINSTILSVEALTPGVYIMQINIGDKKLDERFIVAK